MPSHRFTDNRGRTFVARFDGSSHKLYEDLGDKTERIDGGRLKGSMATSIETSLLQEIIKLAKEAKAVRTARDTSGRDRAGDRA